MKTPPIPISALVSRVRASRTYAHDLRVRISWIELQRRFDAGETIGNGLIGFVTRSLWAACAIHREAQGRYQESLRRREAMPAALRWSVKDLEDWMTANRKRDPQFVEGALA